MRIAVLVLLISGLAPRVALAGGSSASSTTLETSSTADDSAGATTSDDTSSADGSSTTGSSEATISGSDVSGDPSSSSGSTGAEDTGLLPEPALDDIGCACANDPEGPPSVTPILAIAGLLLACALASLRREPARSGR